MRRIETAGNTLIGAVDGLNKTYKVNNPMLLSNVEVFRNGLCKVDFLDDGYTVDDAYTVSFKEPPEIGSTVAVAYTPVGTTAGGYLGGIPTGLVASLVGVPTMTATLPSVALRPIGGTLTASCVCPTTPPPTLGNTSMVVSSFYNGARSLQPGTPVCLDQGGYIIPADAASPNTSQVIGVSASAAQPWAVAVMVVTQGILIGVLVQSQPKQRLYLAIGGGFAVIPPVQPGSCVVLVGQAVNGTDLLVAPQHVVMRGP